MVQPAIKNRSPRAKAVGSIRKWIASGELRTGDPLPSEWAMSVRLGVARATVGRALAILEAEGVIRAAGPRTRVVSTPAAAGDSGLLRRAVAIVASPVDVDFRHEGGWDSAIDEGAAREVRALGYHVLSLHPEHLSEQDIVQLLESGVLGVVVSQIETGPLVKPGDASQILRRLRDAGVPVVAYGGSPLLDGFDRAVSDHDAGSYALTKWLIERGCRRILPLWTHLPENQEPHHNWVAHRRRGYERACQEAGVRPLPVILRGRLQPMTDLEQQFRQEVRLHVGLLMEHLTGSEPADAIMSLSDGEVFSAAAACRHLGKEPGRDVLLVGYDNYWRDSPERAWEPYEPAATVDRQNEETGRELVRLLVARSSGKLPAEPQTRVVPPQLVVNVRT